MIGNDSHETSLPPKRPPIRPRGTPTKILSTPILVETYDLLVSIARRHNVGYGDVVDYLVQRAEAKRQRKLAKSVVSNTISL